MQQPTNRGIIIMKKISKKASTSIAQLINSKDVAEIMARDYREQGDFINAKKWALNECRAVVALFEEFGIKLPTYDQSVDRLVILRYHREGNGSH